MPARLHGNLGGGGDDRLGLAPSGEFLEDDELEPPSLSSPNNPSNMVPEEERNWEMWGFFWKLKKEKKKKKKDYVTIFHLPFLLPPPLLNLHSDMVIALIPSY